MSSSDYYNPSSQSQSSSPPAYNPSSASPSSGSPDTMALQLQIAQLQGQLNQQNQQNQSPKGTMDPVQAMLLMNAMNKPAQQNSPIVISNNNNNSASSSASAAAAAGGVAAPMGVYMVPNGAVWTDWTFGLYACCQKPKTCFYATVCPCHLNGKISELRSGPLRTGYFSGCCAGCCPCGYRRRTDIRAQFFIMGSGCNDCLASCFCWPCARTQEYRELKYRLKPRPVQQAMI